MIFSCRDSIIEILKKVTNVINIRCAVENNRKHNDLCMGAMGYKTSWVTKN